MKKLKERWGIKSNFQLVLIFIVFALTGSASAWLSKPVCAWLGITEDDLGFWFTPTRLLLIFPIYQILLVFIGSVFGQFDFFWNVVKRMLKAIFAIFYKRQA